MFIPLDRLYSFLDQIVDNDVLIYRFYPNGSKNFSDISRLRDYSRIQNWRTWLESIPMLMHDQEPLNFDLYSNIEADEILLFLKNYNAFADSEKYNILDHVIKTMQSNNLVVFKGEYISDCWLLCHSEKNSSELTKYESLDAVGVYWWSHALISRDWYRFAQFDKNLYFLNRNFDKDFNVYNRAWAGTREYRLKFTEMIINNDLLPRSLIKISDHDSGQHFEDYMFRNPKFVITNKDNFSLLPCNQSDSNASADYSIEDYQRSAIDVVLETLFDDTRIHLTEKTLRPIACGKPFIIASTPGCLQYLREYGFETFHQYIDESYDCIKDPLDRLKAIIKIMKDISSLPNNKKNNLYHQLHRIAHQNKKVFWSERFVKKIINEFKENYRKSYAVCKQSQHGQKWLTRRKLLAGYSKEYHEFLCSDNNFRSRQDIVKLLIHLKQGKTI